MNIKQIRELAQIVRQNELSALEIIEGDAHIRIERVLATIAPAAPQAASTSAVAVLPSAASAQDDPGVDFNDVIEVKSPMVGVFYAASSPGAKPFVAIGDMVKKGDILCIIEAMKLMNELPSEFEGKVVDVCASNGDVVEYGQTLFKLY